MPEVAIILAPLILIGYGGLTILIVRRSKHPTGDGPEFSWLLALILLGVVAQGLRLFPGSLMLSTYLYAAMLIGLGTLTFVFLKQAGWRWWLVLAGGWWVALLMADLMDGRLLLGALDWTGQAFAAFPPMFVGVLSLGWLGLAAAQIGITLRAVYAAHLPEVANRALYWLMVLALCLLAVLLAASGTALLAELGHLVMLGSIAGAVYGMLSLRLFDVRRVLLGGAGLGLAFGLTTGVVAITLLAQASLIPDGRSGLALTGVLALIAAALIVPLRQLAMWVTLQLAAPASDPARALREYSQRVTSLIDMQPIAQLARQTTAAVLQTRPGLLLLAKVQEDGAVELTRLRTGETGMLADAMVLLKANSPILYRLFVRQRPLLQFDLEYDPAFAALDEPERRFFAGMRASAYAPIVVEGRTIGLLVGGAKLNDEPYTPSDLELLVTIAHQTGGALRNARLVTDLRVLNENLATANLDLERLDAVKTDFITIASHELRTPLAQVRGYADIIETVSNETLAESPQMAELIASLRRATERMEELISDMLDVSRLDVDALDLRFAAVTVEGAVRMALEPLTDAVVSRRISLAARGLRDLPPIEGDLQRLVQAFRNVIGNAIKYTPDGGEITIKGYIEPDGRQVHVEIRDTGIGIDPAYHDLIFEKFFRIGDPGLHSTGSTKFMGAGPGLGLTIAQGVVVGHGGRLWVESTGFDPDRLPGSVFHIMLPVEPPQEALRVAAIEDTRVSASVQERQRLQAAAELWTGPPSNLPEDVTDQDTPFITKPIAPKR